MSAPRVITVDYDAQRDAPEDALRRALEGAVSDGARPDRGHDVVVWYEQRLAPKLDHPERWPERLGTGPEVRHLGLRITPPRVLRALQTVAGEDPFVTPTDDAGDRVSWLLAPEVGVAHVAALRALLDLDDSSSTRALGAPARWAWRAWRASQRGILPVHDDGLATDARALDDAVAANPWSSSDVAWLIDQRWRPSQPWRVRIRQMLTPRSGATSLSSGPAPLGTRPPRGDTIDVIIPTLGRIEPVCDVLDDLAAQSHPPTRVVLVEQHGVGETPPLLARLASRRDPYTLVHRTTDQLGASRARNRALNDTRAPWIALLDDDVRLTPDFLTALLDETNQRGADVVNAGELLPDDPTEPILRNAPPMAVPCAGLGSGRCLIARDALISVGGFDETIEGWGEDQELGLRLNLAGAVVLQSRAVRLVHLHAPRGGFRADRRVLEPWANDRPPPKPSPFIVYRWLRWTTPAGLRGLVSSYLLGALSNASWPGRIVRLPKLIGRWRQARHWARTLLDRGPSLYERPNTCLDPSPPAPNTDPPSP